MKKKPEFEQLLKNFVIATLRRSSYRWPARNDAYKAARIERGLYACRSCHGTFNRKEVRIDHIEPIIPLDGTGFTSWDNYINRLFVKAEGFQVLCDNCHKIKTDMEKSLRKESRNKLKKPLTKARKRVRIK